MTIPDVWNLDTYQEFQKELLQLEDKPYRDFNFKTIFTNYKKIGIRVPILRNIAEKIGKGDPLSFLENVPHTYYEEVMLEGFVIARLKDIGQMLDYFEQYIEKIDNWALCDCVVSSMKIVKKNQTLFLGKILKYVKSSEEYRVRVGLVLLLDYYVEEKYLDSIFEICNHIQLDTYYVNMAIAWLISECFVKEKRKTMAFLKNNQLNSFTQNKAISKIRDSYRVSEQDKLSVLSFKK